MTMRGEIGGWDIGLARNPEPPYKPESEHREDAEELICDECVLKFWTDETDAWFQYEDLVLCPRCAASCIQH